MFKKKSHNWLILLWERLFLENSAIVAEWIDEYLRNKVLIVDSEPITIKYVPCSEFYKIPKKAHDGDACFDLYAATYKFDRAHNAHIYRIGFKMEIPDGFVGHVYPRSSIRNKDCFMANSVSVIDSNYRGEIEITFKNYNDGNQAKPYDIGDKIAQICFDKVHPTEWIPTMALSKTDRGENGHGSTGN